MQGKKKKIMVAHFPSRCYCLYCKCSNSSLQKKSASSTKLLKILSCCALHHSPKTYRQKYLLLSSNIKETSEISKAINQSSLAVAQHARWRSFCIILYCTAGALGLFFIVTPESFSASWYLQRILGFLKKLLSKSKQGPL